MANRARANACVRSTAYRQARPPCPTAQVTDLNGRPHFLVDGNRQAIGELY